MHYVALLSGGKDSCFNLLHCQKNGHNLVATASLGPEPGQGEIDSYMYQTVGQDAIHLVAQALEVPLYRRTIRGTAVNQDLEYGSRESLTTVDNEDEAEDLYALLSTVKDNHPDITGVSAGAILSNYQRTRVEHVCQRLQLTPLCYLWQRDQGELLQEMIDHNVDAILIKTAGMGLTARHLGMSIRAMQPTLLKLNDLYGAHICGEGGEYETLTLDCPLFKHRIVIDATEIVVHSDSGFASVAYLKIESAHLEPKPPLLGDPSSVSAPNPFGPSDLKVYNAITPDLVSSPSELTLKQTINETSHCDFKPPHCSKAGPWVAIGNIQADIRYSHAQSVEDETRECFESLIKCLNTFSMGLTDVAFITLLLSSMDLFPAVNTCYSTYFGRSPPARACIGVDLPGPSRLRLECIAYAGNDTSERLCLHVQGLSYWAPANIGPYSQAIVMGRRMFVSGQIGLLPANNVLPVPASLRDELTLSLRHINKVVETVKQTYFHCRHYHIQSAIMWMTELHHMEAIKLGVSASSLFQVPRVPLFFVVVASLPKGALVESQVVLHTPALSDEDSKAMDPLFLEGDISNINVHWEISFFETWEDFSMLIALSYEADNSSLRTKLFAETPLPKILDQVKAIRVFYTSNVYHIQSLLLQLLPQGSMPSLTMIPSRTLVTQDHNSWDYVLLFFG